MNEDMSQFLGVFLDEAREQIVLLEEDILKLEQSPSVPAETPAAPVSSPCPYTPAMKSECVLSSKAECSLKESRT